MKLLIEKLRTERIEAEIPASKSILNRALLLAALSEGETTLVCGELCEDCLVFSEGVRALGAKVRQVSEGLRVTGCGALSAAEIDVKGSGTAARFFSAAAALLKGDCTFTASEQFSRRPMDLGALERLGAEISCAESPFSLRVRGRTLATRRVEVDTDKSTQLASGLLLASAFAAEPDAPITVLLTGTRTHSPYLALTLSIMESFHIPFVRTGDEIAVFPPNPHPARFEVEADLSSACYFCAAALLLKTSVFMRGVRLESLQPDRKFLALLRERGLKLSAHGDGLLAEGTVDSFEGFDADFSDCSDQALTAAALAPFASTPSRLRNIAHIRGQECDRIHAAEYNLAALGVPCRGDKSSLLVFPAPVRSLEKQVPIRTFGDHRVAMAFSLIGCKTGNIVLDDVLCCRKTFPRFFEILKKHQGELL